MLGTILQPTLPILISLSYFISHLNMHPLTSEDLVPLLMVSPPHPTLHPPRKSLFPAFFTAGAWLLRAEPAGSRADPEQVLSEHVQQ